MKTFILILSLVLSSISFAKTVARVIDLKGNAFVFSESSSTKMLKYGSKIVDLSEVMVEDGSTLSLVNDAGHIIHVTGGTLVKFYKGFSEVKNGQVWIVVKQSGSKGLFHTANSIVKYAQGQFIYSFDNVSGKSQLLVLTGQVSFSNALEPDVAINVPSGHFSFVEQNFEKGLPRAATKVGLKSYQQFRSLFANFDSLEGSNMDKMFKSPSPKRSGRSIASVDDQFNFGKRKGKIIKITTYESSRASASAGPMEYYKEIKKKESLKRRPAKTNNSVQIKYFGFNWKNQKKKTKQIVKSLPRLTIKTNKIAPQKTVIKMVNKKMKRAPASIGGTQDLIKELAAPSSFEKSLQKSAQDQKRHTKEVNSLIDDLKSYKQDYKKEY